MRLVLVCVTLACVTAGRAWAQTSQRVVAGFGVDTTSTPWSTYAWHREAAEIYRLWVEYLRTAAGTYQPTELWSAAEQRQWPLYDLATGTAYQGFPATVLDIWPANPENSEFAIRTLFAAASGDAHDVRPIALTTVYAMRENGRWVLSSALSRHTRDWQRATVGPITYIVEGRAVDGARAQRAIAFADSLADALGVPRLEQLTYYVARSPASLHRAMGIDWTFAAMHSHAVTGNRMILSGSPAFGEEHRHELVHMLLVPILEERQTHGIISEGVATRFGGMLNSDYNEVLRNYAQYLAANPRLTLDDVLADGTGARGHHPTGAVLVELVLRAGGAPALLQLVRSGRSDDELMSTLVRLLDTSWENIGVRWRALVMASRA